MQFQRHVEAEVDDLGRLGRQLAEVPVVVRDQQLAGIGSRLFEGELVEGRQGFQIAQCSGLIQGIQLGQGFEVRQLIGGRDRSGNGLGLERGDRLQLGQGSSSGSASRLARGASSATTGSANSAATVTSSCGSRGSRSRGSASSDSSAASTSISCSGSARGSGSSSGSMRSRIEGFS